MAGVFVFTLICNILMTYAYHHVILMHGVLDDASVFHQLKSRILKIHPETNLTILDVFDGHSSLDSMWYQVNGIKKIVVPIMQDNPQGVHLIGYSQGGLLCRGLIESSPFHNVKNFISISSPQGGQYGDTSKFKYFLPHLIKKELYKFFYTREGQYISVGNYWNDPHQHELYLKYSNYLAVINNETNHNESLEYKKSFTKLDNMIMIGGPDDGIITPWQSSHFAAYNENETVVEMKDQEWYKSDWFGLKTLDSRGALHTYVHPNIKHHEWITHEEIFKKYIAPWLT